MGKLFAILVLMLFTNLVSAQSTDDFEYYDPEEPSFNNPVTDDLSPLKKTNFGLMTGASVGMFPGRNSFSSTFIAPHLSYRLSSRLNVNAAAIFSNTQFNSAFERNFNQPGSFNGKSLMMGMDYKISENVRIGAGFSISQGPNHFNQPFGGFGGPFSPGFSPGFSPMFSPMFSPFMGW